MLAVADAVLADVVEAISVEKDAAGMMTVAESLVDLKHVVLTVAASVQKEASVLKDVRGESVLSEARAVKMLSVLKELQEAELTVQDLKVRAAKAALINLQIKKADRAACGHVLRQEADLSHGIPMTAVLNDHVSGSHSKTHDSSKRIFSIV